MITFAIAQLKHCIKSSYSRRHQLSVELLGICFHWRPLLLKSGIVMASNGNISRAIIQLIIDVVGYEMTL